MVILFWLMLTCAKESTQKEYIISQNNQKLLLEALESFEVDPWFWEEIIMGFVEDFKNVDDIFKNLSRLTKTPKYQILKPEVLVLLVQKYLIDFKSAIHAIHDPWLIRQVLEEWHDRTRKEGIKESMWVASVVMRRLVEGSSRPFIHKLLADVMTDIAHAVTLGAHSVQHIKKGRKAPNRTTTMT